MTKTKLPLAEATRLADELIFNLRHYCERIEVAGSIRRKQAEVGDIEIVCIPKLISNEQKPLFPGDEGELIVTWEGDDHIATIADAGSLTKNGERYKQFQYLGYQVDLFLTTPDRWGLIFAIRTGPAEFSKRLVTQKSKGGLLPDDMLVRDGELHVWQEDPGIFRAVATPEEVDLFRLMKLAFIAPEKRQ